MLVTAPMTAARVAALYQPIVPLSGGPKTRTGRPTRAQPAMVTLNLPGKRSCDPDCEIVSRRRSAIVTRSANMADRLVTTAGPPRTAQGIATNIGSILSYSPADSAARYHVQSPPPDTTTSTTTAVQVAQIALDTRRVLMHGLTRGP